MDMETNVIRHDLDWQKEKSQGDAWLHGWLTDHKTTTACRIHVPRSSKRKAPSSELDRTARPREKGNPSEQRASHRAQGCLPWVSVAVGNTHNDTTPDPSHQLVGSAQRCGSAGAGHTNLSILVVPIRSAKNRARTSSN